MSEPSAPQPFQNTWNGLEQLHLPLACISRFGVLIRHVIPVLADDLALDQLRLDLE